MPTPIIPENITVHLGPPNSDAPNITLPFRDYIKNVASSEIYPTWPEAALRANILAQITYALNRIYTEWYPSQGYDFDITNSIAYDQAFVQDRDIFENVSRIVRFLTAMSSNRAALLHILPSIAAVLHGNAPAFPSGAR